jgi:hypothetical protein
MIIRLILTLSYKKREYILYLNNLFISLPLAKALKKCSIKITGITRKNSKNIPKWLLDLKQKNKDLIWNSAVGIIIEGVLIFLW